MPNDNEIVAIKATERRRTKQGPCGVCGRDSAVTPCVKHCIPTIARIMAGEVVPIRTELHRGKYRRIKRIACEACGLPYRRTAKAKRHLCASCGEKIRNAEVAAARRA